MTELLARLASLDIILPLPAAHNYTDPVGPRFAGGATLPHAPASLKLVTFNIKFGLQIAKSVGLLQDTLALRDPDVLLLQEMDESGTAAMAEALGMSWVYYPNTVHPIGRKNFGCAILSRLPMEDDRKILLPHLARFRRIQRAAVAATIVAGTERVRILNVHLATMIDNGPRQRRAQLGPVLDDADAHDRVVLAGDFNSDRVADVALARGFTWPTRGLGRTNALWAMDHVLLKGLVLSAPDAFGAVRDTHRASDHKPVWAGIRLER